MSEAIRGEVERIGHDKAREVRFGNGGGAEQAQNVGWNEKTGRGFRYRKQMGVKSKEEC